MGASIGEVSCYKVDINLEGKRFRSALVMPQALKDLNLQPTRVTDWSMLTRSHKSGFS